MNKNFVDFRQTKVEEFVVRSNKRHDAASTTGLQGYIVLRYYMLGSFQYTLVCITQMQYKIYTTLDSFYRIHFVILCLYDGFVSSYISR